MLYLMSVELYNKLFNVNKFKKMNGNTYQEYILKNTNLSITQKNQASKEITFH